MHNKGFTSSAGYRGALFIFPVMTQEDMLQLLQPLGRHIQLQGRLLHHQASHGDVTHKATSISIGKANLSRNLLDFADIM